MDTVQSEVTLILSAVKNLLKNREMSYQDLAERLGVSESGVKKMLSSKNCTLNRILDFCRVLEVELADLVDFAKGEQKKKATLTARQEAALSDDLELCFFFVALFVHKMSIEEIATVYQLNEQSIQYFLIQLEKIDLIEVQSSDRIRFLVREPLSISPSFRQKYFPVFLDSIAKHFRSRSVPGEKRISVGREWLMSRETLDFLEMALEEAVNNVDRLVARDRRLSAGQLVPVSLAISGVCNEPLRRKISKRQTKRRSSSMKVPAKGTLLGL